MTAVGSLRLAWIRGVSGAPDRVRIDAADPVALLDATLIAGARAGLHAPWLTVQATERGQVLIFTDDYGRRVLYRLGRYVPGTGAHLIEWPD